jgi:hypothetical protein
MCAQEIRTSSSVKNIEESVRANRKEFTMTLIGLTGTALG